jgi:hypothetical protein
MCPASDLAASVVVAACDSGVPNQLLAAGCTISDLIERCGSGAVSHGDFVNCVAELANQLRSESRITGQEKGAIQSCAATTGPRCCEYANTTALPVKDCPKNFTCPGPPAVPVLTDIRCDKKECPATIRFSRRCLNSAGEEVLNIKCEYELSGPSCVPCKKKSPI